MYQWQVVTGPPLGHPGQPLAVLDCEVAIAAAHQQIHAADSFVLLQLDIQPKGPAAHFAVVPSSAVDVMVQNVPTEVADAAERLGAGGLEAAVLGDFAALAASHHDFLPDRASLAGQVALRAVNADQVLGGCRDEHRTGVSLYIQVICTKSSDCRTVLLLFVVVTR